LDATAWADVRSVANLRATFSAWLERHCPFPDFNIQYGAVGSPFQFSPDKLRYRKSVARRHDGYSNVRRLLDHLPRSITFGGCVGLETRRSKLDNWPSGKIGGS
jgi:hypothetical protein